MMPLAIGTKAAINLFIAGVFVCNLKPQVAMMFFGFFVADLGSLWVVLSALK